MPDSVFEKIKNTGILDRGRFGKTNIPLLWVGAESLADIGRALKEDSELAFDWLENFSVMQVEGILVASWFLRSRKTRARVVLRSTMMAKAPDDLVDLPTLTSVWPGARSQEAEASELFGIRFDGLWTRFRLLPEGFKGFPLRKTFDMRTVLARDPGMGAGEASFNA